MRRRGTFPALLGSLPWFSRDYIYVCRAATPSTRRLNSSGSQSSRSIRIPWILLCISVIKGKLHLLSFFLFQEIVLRRLYIVFTLLGSGVVLDALLLPLFLGLLPFLFLLLLYPNAGNSWLTNRNDLCLLSLALSTANKG